MHIFCVVLVVARCLLMNLDASGLLHRLGTQHRREVHLETDEITIYS